MLYYVKILPVLVMRHVSYFKGVISNASKFEGKKLYGSETKLERKMLYNSMGIYPILSWRASLTCETHIGLHLLWEVGI